MTIIDAWAQHPTLRHTDDPMFDSLRRRSPRDIPTGEVPIAATLQSMDEGGVARSPIAPGRHPDRPALLHLYVACCELGVPLCTQIGHTGPPMPVEIGRPIYLDQLAIDFPGLVIVGDHIGCQWTDEAIAIATKHENVHIDASADTVRRYPSRLVDYQRAHGRRKALFGTNYPMIRPAKALEGLDRLGLDDETRALFLGGNAARVFKQ